MAYNKAVLTEKGGAHILAAQGGKQLIFTRIALGDGPPQADLKKAVSLSNQTHSINIDDIEIQNNQVKVKSTISNKDLVSGFFIKEIGLYSRIDGEEVLYCICNSTEQADYIPGRAHEAVEETFVFSTQLVEGVTPIVELTSETYASKEDVEKALILMNQKYNALQMSMAVTQVQVEQSTPDSLFLQNSGQRFYNYLNDTDEIDLVNSADITHDAVNHKIKIGTGKVVMKPVVHKFAFNEIITRTYYNVPFGEVEAAVNNSNEIALTLSKPLTNSTHIKIGNKILKISETRRL